MKTATLLALLALSLLPLTLQAELSETLKFLAAKSDIIAVATVIAPPEFLGGSAPMMSGDPVAYWTDPIVRVKILTTLKGASDQPQPLITARTPAVAENRRIDRNDNPIVTARSMYAQGRKCILFLQDRRTNAAVGDKTSQNGEVVNLVAFDPFFSCQGYDYAMEVALRELLASLNKPE